MKKLFDKTDDILALRLLTIKRLEAQNAILIERVKHLERVIYDCGSKIFNEMTNINNINQKPQQ